MSDFQQAIRAVLVHEGGYTVDHAGPTNWGVTLPVLKAQPDVDGDGYLDGDLDRDGDVDVDDIRAMTPQDAMRVYKFQWWDRYGYARIEDQAVATKMLDMSINMGPGRAHRLLQRALNGGAFCRLIVDGILGPKTLAATNSFSAIMMLVWLRTEMWRFYQYLLGRHPEWEKFRNGWYNRAMWPFGSADKGRARL